MQSRCPEIHNVVQVTFSICGICGTSAGCQWWWEDQDPPTREAPPLPSPRRLFAETHLCNRLRVCTGQVVKINLTGQEFGENELGRTVLLGPPRHFSRYSSGFSTDYYQTRWSLAISDRISQPNVEPNQSSEKWEYVSSQSKWSLSPSSVEIFSLKNSGIGGLNLNHLFQSVAAASLDLAWTSLSLPPHVWTAFLSSPITRPPLTCFFSQYPFVPNFHFFHYLLLYFSFPASIFQNISPPDTPIPLSFKDFLKIYCSPIWFLSLSFNFQFLSFHCSHLHDESAYIPPGTLVCYISRSSGYRHRNPNINIREII